MKVFDLQCSQGHVFEGWFGSEADFQQQHSNGLLQCPVCACAQIEKRLSAPRLNLGAAPPPQAPAAATASSSASSASTAAPTPSTAPAAQDKLHALQAAWLRMSRHIAQHTQDVGAHFAEQALGMHRGELEEKPIRGQATPEQAQQLLEEGVPVLPLALPKTSTETLQ